MDKEGQRKFDKEFVIFDTKDEQDYLAQKKLHIENEVAHARADALMEEVNMAFTPTFRGYCE